MDNEKGDGSRWSNLE